MRDILKMLFIPIIGAIGITLIFVLVVWGGGWQDEVVDPRGIETSYGEGIVGYAIFDGSQPCADLYDPVCGYDGNTYDNACKAKKADTRVAYQGACLS